MPTRAVRIASKHRSPTCPEEAAFLDLLRTTDLLSRGLLNILKREDLSATQYNVLRILRGAPGGLPCGEIAKRMITRDRSEEHTSELQSHVNLVCRLLLETKK